MDARFGIDACPVEVLEDGVIDLGVHDLLDPQKYREGIVKGFATDIGETCAWITGLARDGIQRL